MREPRKLLLRCVLPRHQTCGHALLYFPPPVPTAGLVLHDGAFLSRFPARRVPVLDPFASFAWLRPVRPTLSVNRLQAVLHLATRTVVGALPIIQVVLELSKPEPSESPASSPADRSKNRARMVRLPWPVRLSVCVCVCVLVGARPGWSPTASSAEANELEIPGCFHSYSLSSLDLFFVLAVLLYCLPAIALL